MDKKRFFANITTGLKDRGVSNKRGLFIKLRQSLPSARTIVRGHIFLQNHSNRNIWEQEKDDCAEFQKSHSAIVNQIELMFAYPDESGMNIKGPTITDQEQTKPEEKRNKCKQKTSDQDLRQTFSQSKCIT